MARENKTQFSILGMLTFRPMSGYDLKKEMEFSIGNFWNENYAHIYNILRRLEKNGYVTRQTVKSEGRPEKKVYSITESGVLYLDKWLSVPAESYIVRDEFLLKLFFSKRVPLEKRIQIVNDKKQGLLEVMEKFKQIKGIINSQMMYKEDSNLPYWELTLDNGFDYCEVMIKWCDKTIEKLKMIDAQS